MIASLAPASLVALTLTSASNAAPYDPCTGIAGKKWVSPQQARACFTSFPVDKDIKSNIIEVVNKTLAFHTSVSYQVQAPPPFEDTHEDLMADLARISHQPYNSDFDLHIDLSRSVKRANDGHCAYINFCYDSLFVSYLPTPLVLLTAHDGSQHVHIAPEAYDVAKHEFHDQIHVWEDAVSSQLNDTLRSLSGAKVLSINREDPFIAVNANALVTGGYQGFGTRQNSYFSSYSRTSDGWSYMMGNFAQQSLPLSDYVSLVIQRVNHSSTDSIILPYRSRFSSSANNFTDSTSYRANNCVAVNGTNGHNIYEHGFQITSTDPKPFFKALQEPRINPREARRQPMNVVLDAIPYADVSLPERLQPSLKPADTGYGVSQTYMLEGNQTGVLVLGSFSAPSFSALQKSLLKGLLGLKKNGAKRLIVDVTNNGGGYICLAHWLHRIIVGPKSSSEPQAGLYTAARAGPLAQLIVNAIVEGEDPEDELLYNPTHWTNATHVQFERSVNWMKPTVKVEVNGRVDYFSQRLGQECQPFDMDPPDEPLFDGKDVVIISNGRCASSCSLFSITMAKLEGATTVVVGGKQDIPQQYCGVVGGQSTDFSTIDEEIKSVKLKNHTLAPPDFLTNSVQGITWRLGYGIDDETQPEEWQDHPADITLPLTPELVNNPRAIWEDVDRRVFGGEVQGSRYSAGFRVQT